jgi:hypothetical protein
VGNTTITATQCWRWVAANYKLIKNKNMASKITWKKTKADWQCQSQLGRQRKGV